jgi:hypothetical protein
MADLAAALVTRETRAICMVQFSARIAWALSTRHIFILIELNVDNWV